MVDRRRLYVCIVSVFMTRNENRCQHQLLGFVDVWNQLAARCPVRGRCVSGLCRWTAELCWGHHGRGFLVGFCAPGRDPCPAGCRRLQLQVFGAADNSTKSGLRDTAGSKMATPATLLLESTWLPAPTAFSEVVSCRRDFQCRRSAV